MVDQIYPTELQVNKVNSSYTDAPFSDLDFSITNGIVSSKIYDKWDNVNFEIENFPFFDGDVPGSPSYYLYISLLIPFAGVCPHGDDFNNRNLFCMLKNFLNSTTDTQSYLLNTTYNSSATGHIRTYILWLSSL